MPKTTNSINTSRTRWPDVRLKDLRAGFLRASSSKQTFFSWHSFFSKHTLPPRGTERRSCPVR